MCINLCPFLFCSIYIDIAILADRDYHICSSFINNFSLVNIVDDQMSILINTYNSSNTISSIISFFTIFPIYNVIACVVVECNFETSCYGSNTRDCLSIVNKFLQFLKVLVQSVHLFLQTIYIVVVILTTNECRTCKTTKQYTQKCSFCKIPFFVHT